MQSFVQKASCKLDLNHVWYNDWLCHTFLHEFEFLKLTVSMFGANLVQGNTQSGCLCCLIYNFELMCMVKK